MWGHFTTSARLSAIPPTGTAASCIRQKRRSVLNCLNSYWNLFQRSSVLDNHKSVLFQLGWNVYAFPLICLKVQRIADIALAYAQAGQIGWSTREYLMGLKTINIGANVVAPSDMMVTMSSINPHLEENLSIKQDGRIGAIRHRLDEVCTHTHI
jgi:hypothetical protein